MKTSFYFVLWIAIYPILGAFNSSVIDNNAFIIALAAVWGLSWYLNKLMPETLTYERASQMAPILENVYQGNIGAFIKHLRSETVIAVVTALYFLVSTVVIAIAVFALGVSDWLALLVFGLFTFTSIWQSIILNGHLSAVKANPTQEQSAATIEELYKLDYAAYSEGRQSVSYEAMLPPRPERFKAFQIISLVVAGICSLLGLIYIVRAAIIWIVSTSLTLDAISGMTFLYGSLAAYFGLKDCYAIIRSLRATPAASTEPSTIKE